MIKFKEFYPYRGEIENESLDSKEFDKKNDKPCAVNSIDYDTLKDAMDKAIREFVKKSSTESGCISQDNTSDRLKKG